MFSLFNSHSNNDTKKDMAQRIFQNDEVNEVWEENENDTKHGEYEDSKEEDYFKTFR